MADLLQDLLHGYGIMLDEAQLMPLGEQLPDVWAHFKAELQTHATIP